MSLDEYRPATAREIQDAVGVTDEDRANVDRILRDRCAECITCGRLFADDELNDRDMCADCEETDGM